MAEEGKAPQAGATRAVDVDFAQLAEALKPLSYDKRLALLQFLTEPHYLEEIASHLGIARQAAKKHVDKLLDIGVIEKQRGERDSGPVTEYLIVPQRLFELTEQFSKLGTLESETEDDGLERTQTLDAPAGGMPKAARPALAVVHGRDQGEIHRLDGPGPWTIGRDEENEIVLDYDPFASNRHAEVRREADGHVLVDRFATNGTYRNWEQLDRGDEVTLTPGDVVGIGKSLLVYWG